MLRALKVVSTALVVLGLAACTTVDESMRGTWRAPDLDGSVIDIKSDGSFDGFDGCNSFAGKVLAEHSSDGEFSFEIGISGASGCLNGAGAWTNEAVQVRIEGQDLEVLDPGGRVIGEFHR